MKNISTFCIEKNECIKNTLKRMDVTGEGILYVTENVNGNMLFLGLITDGDLRRAIINGASISDSISKYYNQNPIKVVGDPTTTENQQYIKSILSNRLIPGIPIVDEKNYLVDHALRSGLIKNAFEVKSNKISIPVVIMAGGKGTRLDPFTRILPKPLIPIGEKAAIEVIADNFNSIGVNKFYISINYKKEMIISFFENIKTNYQVNYLIENNFMGTAGCLSLLPADVGSTFMVSNCDIFVHTDYEAILKFHFENKNKLTIVGAFQHLTIPYGVLEYGNKGVLEKIIEKPEYDFVINTGLYILDYEVIKYIPKDSEFSMVDLINKLKESNLNVGVFPVSEKSYMDIGQWEEYHKNSEKLM